MTIRLSDHFNCRRLLRFTLPSIVMMIFTSVYGVVDGFFVSNFVGKTPFAAVLLLPLLWGIDGIWFSVVVAEVMAVAVGVVFLALKRKKYQY